MLKIQNTLSRKLEEFKPLEEGKVKFYHCGPTVYWSQHIGNMRGMTMADLIRRSLIYIGNDVEFVRNYTDVGHLTSDEDEGEDKMAKGAKREGLTPDEIADKYIQIFEDDLKTLNNLPVEHKPRATIYVPQMIKLVQRLLENGYAYSTPKAIYFDVSKKEDYTKLSRQKLEENISGAGSGDVADSDKRNPQDFAVWFFKTGAHKNALQTWESPFESSEVENGEGFPGWHIECSAMSMDILGDTMDIHMGGIEHIPVHHTNEIAQSEGATGKVFANYWLHNEHLAVDGGKMSKSLGNVNSVSEIVEKGYDSLVLRYFFLQSHYRSKQNFTWQALDASQSAFNNLKGQVRVLFESLRELNIEKINEEWKGRFVKALENDFNIPQALAVVWDMMKSDISDGEKLSTVLDFDNVLGLNLETCKSAIHSKQEITPEIQSVLDERQKARDNKDWAKSDELRDKLKDEFGIEVKDTADGQIVV